MTVESARLHLAPVLVLGLSVSCVGTDVGNPPDDEREVAATLEFAAYDGPVEDEAELAAALVLEDGSEIDSAWFVVERLAVRPASDCSQRGERVVGGPFVVDLVQRKVYPNPPVLTREREELCLLKLTLGPVKELPPQAPDRLAGRSFVTSGAAVDGTPYQLATSDSRTLVYAGTSLVADDHVRFVATFVPRLWLTGVGFENLPDPPPDMPVDLGRDAASATRFLRNFAATSRVVADRDDDGEVSNEEFDSPAAHPAE